MTRPLTWLRERVLRQFGRGDAASPHANALSMGAAELVAKPFGLLTGMYLNRLLGPTLIGQLSIASVTVSFFSLILWLGLDVSVMRGIAVDRAHPQPWVNRVISLRLVLTLVAYAGVVLYAFTVPQWVPRLAPIVPLYLLEGVILLTIALRLESVFMGLGAMGPVALSRIMQSLVGLVLMLFLVTDPSHYLRVPTLYQVGGFAACAVMYVSYRRLAGRFRWDFTWTGARSLMRESAAVSASRALVSIYYSADTYMLGLWFPAAIVGYYAKSYYLLLVAEGLLGYYFHLLLPKFAAMREGDPRVLGAYLRRQFGIAVLGGILCAGGTVLVAKYLVLLFMGDQFMPSIGILQGLAGTFLFTLPDWVLVNYLLAQGRSRELLWVSFWMAALNLGLNLFVIPRYGMQGAVATTLASKAGEMVMLLRCVGVRTVLGGASMSSASTGESPSSDL